MKIFVSNISPCKAFTLKGKLVLFITKQLVTLVSWCYKFDATKPMIFEENPKTMSTKELIYFAYKYYVKNISAGVKGEFLSFPQKTLNIKEIGDYEHAINLNIGGDLMPYKLINEKSCSNLWREREGFFDADIIAGNLETPINLKEKPQYVPEMMLSNMNFNASLQQFNAFRGNEFDVLSLANNHSLDMGYKGAQETLAFLAKRNVSTCGVGHQDTHCIIDRKGIKVGFLSYTYSLNQHEADQDADLKINHLPLNKVNGCDITPIIIEAKKVRDLGADYVVLFIHTGNAYQPFPGPQTQLLFKDIATQSEVDFIAGGHPHNIQPLQKFTLPNKTVFACYSLSDFIAYDIYQRCHLSVFLSLKLHKQNEKVSLTSITVNSNYMEYEKGQLTLKNFDDMMKQPISDKKIADLQQLYHQTIIGPFS